MSNGVTETEVLLARRPASGEAPLLWGLVGGTPEVNEDLERASRRESMEEAALQPLELDRVADLYFYSDHELWAPYYHAGIFSCSEFTGQVAAVGEVEPRWFAEEGLPYSAMWPADQYWLPLVLANRKVVASVLTRTPEGGTQPSALTLMSPAEVVSGGTSDAGDTADGPCLVILGGPPAAGKSTLMAPIVQELGRLLGRPVVGLSTDMVVMAQYPDALTGPPLAYKPSYRFEGARIIFDDAARAEMTERATAGLAVVVSHFLSQPKAPLLVCEFPVGNASAFVRNVAPSLPPEGAVWVVELSADAMVRRERNDERGDSRLEDSAQRELETAFDLGAWRGQVLDAFRSRELGWIAVDTDEAIALTRGRLKWALQDLNRRSGANFGVSFESD